MKFVIYIKDNAEVDRIAKYIHHLPAKADFEDVIDCIERVDE